MGRLPVAGGKVTPHGAYHYDRGDHIHQGVDLAASPGDEVVAPEAGELLVASWGKLGKPWTGYDPGVVVLRGASGRYHVLAHLDAADLQQRWPDVTGVRVDEGQVVGLVSSAAHVHWEVRKQLLTDRYDPAVWVRAFVPSTALRGDVQPQLEHQDALVLIVLGLVAAFFVGGRKR